VTPLLPASTVHRVLVTSRHLLADLPGSRMVEVSVLAEDEATALLDTILRIRHPGDSRAGAHPADARGLVELCGYLPLAISIVAAVLAEDIEPPIHTLIAALDAESARLDELSCGPNLSVRAAFDFSYAALTTDEARLFRLLSLNPGPQVSTDTAAALAGLPVRETARLLNSLRRAHLLDATETYGSYRQHDLLRLFAKDRADLEDDNHTATEAQQRLVSYYLARTRDANGQIRQASLTRIREHRRGALDWLNTERTNLISG
jgi:hypothetical protein